MTKYKECLLFFRWQIFLLENEFWGGWGNGLRLRGLTSQVWFPALSWWLTNKYHLSSRSSNALFWPLGVLCSHGTHTPTYFYKIKKLGWMLAFLKDSFSPAVSASKIHGQTSAMWVCFSCSSTALQPDLKEPPSFRMRSFIDYNNSKMDVVGGSQQLCPNKEVLWPWLPCLNRRTTSQGNFPSNSLSMKHETNVWNYRLKHDDQEERRGIMRSTHGLWFYVASCQFRSRNTKELCYIRSQLPGCCVQCCKKRCEE